MDRNGHYPPPRLVFWETTAGCNLQCKHCRRITVADTLTPLDLDTNDAKGLIDQLRATGQPVLVLSGGEALMRPDILEVARYAENVGLPTALATNGTLIDTAVAEGIRDAGIRRVAISFDGSDAATHDAFRGLPGSFDGAIAGAAALRRAGVPVQVNTTVANHNKGQLEGMIALTREIGAVAMHLFLLVPVGCGLEIAPEEMISAEEYEKTLNWLYDAETIHSDLQLRATCAPHYHRVKRQRASTSRRESGDGDAESGRVRDAGRSGGHVGDGHPAPTHTGRLHSETKGCLAGTGVAFISHKGDVFPCGYFPVSAGSIRSQRFGDIWQTSELFQELRDGELLRGKCGICEFRFVCAGCRARAYGVTGDYLAEEPFCAYQPVGNGSLR